jgi:cell division protein FtsI/penicillin-binding protein 2
MGIVAVVVVVAAVGTIGFVALRGDDDPAAPTPVSEAAEPVADYLAAWHEFDYPAMERLVAQPPESFVAQHEQMVEALEVRGARFEPGAVRPVPGDDTRATASFDALVHLRGLGPWRYEGRIDLTRVVVTENGTRSPASAGEPGGTWLVDWSPATLHPEMRTGVAFARARSRPERGAILDRDGTVLVGGGTVVQIGVEPRRITDRDALAAALEEQLQVTRAELDRALAGAQPDWFVPVASMPRGPRYDAVRAVLYPIPGVLFRETKDRVRPDPEFARHVLGRTHEITAEELETLGEATYDAGDEVGSSGIEESYETQLAGTPSGNVHLVDVETGERVGPVLHRFRGKAPQAVTTTLDPSVQAAADAALAGVAQPAGLVAVDVGTGEVLAAASRPLDGFDRAITGRYPPGSTFKIVSATASLNTGATAGTTITCPGALEVGGRTFHNFEGEAAGTIDFATAFAHSCNNAFIQLAQRAGEPALATAARQFGFGVDYEVGLPHFGGSFPEPVDVVELAAASIGQGRVEASPLHMASVAATAANGQWRPPVVVRGVANDAVGTEPIAPAALGTLQSFMAAVVSQGTGEAAAVPGRDVRGKTGTAEFGDTDPAPTHAWFVGYSGNVAFAVLVEGGGVGGQVAAPLAQRFVAALP